METIELSSDRLRLIEERLGALEDLEALKRLHTRYVNHLTFAEWDDIAECFTEDAVFDLCVPEIRPLVGRAAIAALFKHVISTGHLGKEGNFTVHPLIEVDGASAKGWWLIYLMYNHADTGLPAYWVQGIYDCQYEKADGQWKISSLRFVGRLAPPTMPVPPDDAMATFGAALSGLKRESG
jgi:ketosteroid isomerase-like protein